MSERPADAETPGTPVAPHESRIAFESLRERTDELELIISGLTVFALLALPSWMFELWLQGSAHAAGAAIFVQMFVYQFASGLSYTIAGAFMLHLAIRAYWVGLIGLKAIFPAGIRWDRIGTLGPLSREYYQQRIPDLGSAIDSVDRAASMVFALASLVMLTVLWAVSFFAVNYLLVLPLGWLLGLGERNTMLLALVVYSCFALLTGLVWLLDTKLMKRRPQLQHSPRFRALIRGLLKAVGLVYPQRLVLPVQLALQSNLSSRVFVAGLAVVMLAAPLLGLVHVVNARLFTVFGDYAWLDDDAVEVGFSGAHYENLRSSHDRLLRVPMIPADVVSGSYLRLFLPYLPDRDNSMLESRCGTPGSGGSDAAAIEVSEGEGAEAEVSDARTAAAQPGAASAADAPGDEAPSAPPTEAAAGPVAAAPESEAAAAKSPHTCLASLWQVTLDGRTVDVGEFLSSERRDLGLRGLQGYLALEGLAAGRHNLEIHWNVEGPADGQQRRRQYHVPFWLAPDFETGMQ